MGRPNHNSSISIAPCFFLTLYSPSPLHHHSLYQHSVLLFSSSFSPLCVIVRPSSCLVIRQACLTGIIHSEVLKSDLNTTLWYMLLQKSHKNATGEYFLRDHFPLRVIKYHHTECNNPFVVVFRECSVLIFVKYDLKIPSPASHVDI